MRGRPAGFLIGLVCVLAGCAPAAALPPSPASAPSPATPTLLGIQTRHGTLFVTPQIGSADRDAWSTRLDWAAESLEATDLGGLTDDWDGRLDVELTAAAAEFSALAGPDSADAAAVTRCLAGRGRIAVNPQVLILQSDYLDGLLLHEAVHAALASPCAAGAPLWVEEGLAEWVATEHSPLAEQADLAWAKQTLAADGVPQTLPPDAAFAGGQLLPAYALSRSAVAAAVEHGGTDWAMAFFGRAIAGTATADEVARVTGWYRADLTRLAGSERDGK
ncbi:MAG: hypothetical protein VB093_13280 [Propionicimonas sp.]|nr:hypothetical protein [Propionicimonas sp.]